MPNVPLPQTLALGLGTAAFFWAGVGLVSIPIIIHILNRQRFRVVTWAAMEFLLRAMRKNRKRPTLAARGASRALRPTRSPGPTCREPTSHDARVRGAGLLRVMAASDRFGYFSVPGSRTGLGIDR